MDTGTTAIDREDIVLMFEKLAEVEKALGDLPYRAAKPAMQTLQELHDMLGDMLPGGLYGQCEACSDLIGNGEDFVATDDGAFCAACVRLWNEAGRPGAAEAEAPL